MFWVELLFCDGDLLIVVLFVWFVFVDVYGDWVMLSVLFFLEFVVFIGIDVFFLLDVNGLFVVNVVLNMFVFYGVL